MTEIKEGDNVVCTDHKNCYGEEPHKVVKIINRHMAQVLYPNGCYTYEFLSCLTPTTPDKTLDPYNVRIDPAANTDMQ